MDGTGYWKCTFILAQRKYALILFFSFCQISSDRASGIAKNNFRWRCSRAHFTLLKWDQQPALHWICRNSVLIFVLGNSFILLSKLVQSYEIGESDEAMEGKNYYYHCWHSIVRLSLSPTLSRNVRQPDWPEMLVGAINCRHCSCSTLCLAISA